MGKRKPLLSTDRLRNTWSVRRLDSVEGELEGFDQLISSAVSRCLSEGRLNRGKIAESLSSLLAEDVSRWMLDAYASEARRNHSISAHRFLALIAVTERFDVLDAVLREIGGKALSRKEIATFELGVRCVEKLAADRRLEEVVDNILVTLRSTEEDAESASAETAEERQRNGEEYVSSDFVNKILDGDNPLRVCRQQRGMTLKDLASKSGVSYSYICELEKGHKQPGSVWSKLAGALGVAIEDIRPD